MDPIQASRAVLIEVMNVLGRYRESLVLVGGWVPDLLLPGRGHGGSLDVDLAVDVRRISQGQYDTILQRLTDARYTYEGDGFTRQVRDARAPVHLHVIAGQYADDAGGPARLQEIPLGRLRGIDLAFDSFDEITVGGELPDGGKNTVRLRIVSIQAFLVMKAFALSERVKPKDAYDVYFCLKHYPDGAAELAGLCQRLPHNRLVRQGIAILRDKFAAVDSVGPTWAAQVAEENGAALELAQREAFELMKDFLAVLAQPREGEP